MHSANQYCACPLCVRAAAPAWRHQASNVAQSVGWTSYPQADTERMAVPSASNDRSIADAPVYPTTSYPQHAFDTHWVDAGSATVTSSMPDRGFRKADGSQRIHDGGPPLHDVAQRFPGVPQHTFSHGASSSGGVPQTGPTTITPFVESTKIYHIEHGVIDIVQRVRYTM